MKCNTLFIIALACSILFSCNKGEANPDKPEIEKSETETDSGSKSISLSDIRDLNAKGHSLDSHTGLIDRSSLMLMHDTYTTIPMDLTRTTDVPLYPRITRAKNGNYILFYHQRNGSSTAGNQCYYMTSPDLKEWRFRSELYKQYTFIDPEYGENEPIYRAFAGCDLMTLQDGRILSVASFRHRKNYRYKREYNGLCMRISNDNGETFGEEIEIYQGTTWEPCPIQLPNGRIEIYFTDCNVPTPGIWTEAEYGEEITNGTDTGLIYSDDNGKTWTPSFGNEPIKAARQIRAYDETSGTYLYTDQMPSVICLHDGKRRVCANESAVGIPKTYYISLSYTDNEGNWGGYDEKGNEPARRNNNFIRGCAPYLQQFPSGEVFLSYNRSESGSNRFFIRRGDENAENFSDETSTFGDEIKAKGYWGSIYAESPHELVAVIGGSDQVLQVGRLYLNHAITASTHTVNIDSDNAEWKNDDEALYVGAHSSINATMRCSKDANNIFFLFEVQDSDISKDDYVRLLIGDPETSSVSEGALRIDSNFDGIKTMSRYAKIWEKADFDATCAGAYEGTLDSSTKSDKGYFIEIAVPMKNLPVKHGQILVNFAVIDKNAGEDAIESISSSSTQKWIPVLGL